MAYDGDFNLTLISLDNFYFGIDKTKVSLKDYNWDHPDALDFDEAYRVLLSLIEGKPTQVPRYSFIKNKREDEYDTVYPNEVIFFEGLFALYDRRIRNLMNYRIFIHCDDDIRLCRRIIRDVNERGFVVEAVLYQYNRFVKPAYDNYIKSTMNYADIIVPGSKHNQVSYMFITQHLKNITN